LNLQSFPKNYQFPENYSLTKIASLLGNSINLTALQHFLKDKEKKLFRYYQSLSFIDLFCGIGGFHLVLQDYGKCVLALDNSKSSSETYQLNFPFTPFSLGDINDRKVQQEICQKDFDLLCAGFPCQPFSKAGNNQRASPELTSLLSIIKKKKPQYLLLENVPNFLLMGSSKFLLPLLKNYHLQISILNPLELGIKHNRPRLFI